MRQQLIDILYEHFQDNLSDKISFLLSNPRGLNSLSDKELIKLARLYIR